MGKFECSTCGGNKHYLTNLRCSLGETIIKQALKEIHNFSEGQIEQLYETSNALFSHLELMLRLLSTDDLRSIFDAWMLTNCRTDIALTIIDKGHKKHWDYSREAVTKLLEKNKDEIQENIELRSKIRGLILDLNLNIDWDT